MRPHVGFGPSTVPPAPPIYSLAHKAHGRSPELRSAHVSGEWNVLPLNRLIDRVDRLESCVESELRATLQVCRGAVVPASEEQREIVQGITEAFSRIARLEATALDVSQQLQQQQNGALELSQQLQQRAPADELGRCLTEADWLALQQRLDERFGAHMERALQHRVDLEAAAKTWQDTAHRRCCALEKRMEQTTHEPSVGDQVKPTAVSEAVMHEFSRKLEALTVKCSTLEQRTVLSESHTRAAVEIKALQQQRQQDSLRLKTLETLATETLDDSTRLAEQQRQHDSQQRQHDSPETFTMEVRDDRNDVDEDDHDVDDHDDHAAAYNLHDVEDHPAHKLVLERHISTSTKETSSLARQKLETAAGLARQQLDSTVSELRADMLTKMDTLRSNLEQKVESMGVQLDFGHRLGLLERHTEGLAESRQGHWDRFATELRTEVGRIAEASGQKFQFDIDELRSTTANFKKDHEIEELLNFATASKKQLKNIEERHMEDNRLSGERARALLHTMEELRSTSQRGGSRFDDFESRLEAFKDTSQHELERMVRDVRAEAQSNLAASESKLVLLTQELQSDAGGFRRDLERMARDLPEIRGTMSKQVQSVLDEVRTASERAGSATQAGHEASAAADRAERRLQNFEERVDAVLEGYQTQLTRSVSDLRMEATASADSTKKQFEHTTEELRANSNSLLKQIERSTVELRSELATTAEANKKQMETAADELLVANSTVAKKVGSFMEDLAASDESSRTVARLVEEAGMAARNADSRVIALESRVEASVDGRCQRSERACKESGQEARSHADSLSKQLNHTLVVAVEELRGTLGTLAKQVRGAVDDARGADQRGVVAAKIAQEASAATQRLESAAARKPDVDMTKLLREQLGIATSELRLENKKGVDMLGKEMESTTSELRGTIGALAMQVECGISGHTSALSDAAETSAQRHVDYLEWLRTLDTHRGQMEKQQMELEERLSSLLGSQKVSLEAELSAVNLQAAQQHSRISGLDTGFTNASSGVENLRAHVSSLQIQLKARALEWEGFSNSIQERVGSLQAGLAENKWGMVTIAGAISTIGNSETSMMASPAPSRYSRDGDSRYVLGDAPF